MKQNFDIDALSATQEQITALISGGCHKPSNIGEILNIRCSKVNEQIHLIKKQLEVDSIKALEEKVLNSVHAGFFLQQYKDFMLEHRFAIFAKKIRHIIKSKNHTIAIKATDGVANYYKEYAFVQEKFQKLGFNIDTSPDATKHADLIVYIKTVNDEYHISHTLGSAKHNLVISIRPEETCECNCQLYFSLDDTASFYDWITKVIKLNFNSNEFGSKIKNINMDTKEICNHVQSIKNSNNKLIIFTTITTLVASLSAIYLLS